MYRLIAEACRFTIGVDRTSILARLIWTSEAILVAAFIPLFKVRHLTGHDPTLAKRCMPWRVAIVISTRQRLESDFNKFMLRHCYRSIWMCHASLASQLDAWISSCFFVFVKRAPQHPSVLDTQRFNKDTISVRIHSSNSHTFHFSALPCSPVLKVKSCDRHNQQLR